VSSRRRYGVANHGSTQGAPLPGGTVWWSVAYRGWLLSCSHCLKTQAGTAAGSSHRPDAALRETASSTAWFL